MPDVSGSFFELGLERILVVFDFLSSVPLGFRVLFPVDSTVSGGTRKLILCVFTKIIQDGEFHSSLIFMLVVGEKRRHKSLSATGMLE